MLIDKVGEDLSYVADAQIEEAYDKRRNELIAAKKRGATPALSQPDRTGPKADMSGPGQVSGEAFEVVGMVKGKATTEVSWFRRRAEQGGVTIYKARAVVDGWKLSRDFLPGKHHHVPPPRDR